jgi:hypothetical protein
MRGSLPADGNGLNPLLQYNGGGGCGTVFKLSPNSNGTYKETRILVFTGSEIARVEVARNRRCQV